MATATSSYQVSSGGKTYTVTNRLTYTTTAYNTYYSITATKYEVKINATGGNIWSGQNDLNKGYYDASGTWHSEKSGAVTKSLEYTTSYQTIWSGSVTFNSYRKTSATTARFSTLSISIPALQSYNITYSASGASGVPSTTIKYYGVTCNIATGTPAKTGYTFVNWKATNGTYYLPGASYTANAATTMTAQWTANKYTVSYNANGGTGTVASQTKTYDTALNFQSGSTLSRKETVNGIIREYTLLKWNTNPDGSGTSYNLSSAIPNITSNLKVYAIWRLDYFYPKISNLKDYRTATADISDEDRADEGEYIFISFDFVGCSSDGGSTYRAPVCVITIDNDYEYRPELTLSTATTGSLKYKPNRQFSKDNPHTVNIQLYDSTHTASSAKAYDYITTGIYPIDLYSNDNNEVYMGIMHPYNTDYPVTMSKAMIDGHIYIRGGIYTNQMGIDLSLPDNNVQASQYPAMTAMRDVANRTIARLEGVINTDGSVGTNWYVRNFDTNGQQVAQKGISYVVDKTGSIKYIISDPAKFRSALDLEVTTPSVTITSSTGTYVSHTIRKTGHLVQLFLAVKNSAVVAEGGNLFVGNLSAYRPIMPSYGNSSYSWTRVFTSAITADGTITIRNAKQATEANTNYYVSFVYITAS